MKVLLNLLKDYLLQPFFMAGALNFGPATATPTGPAPRSCTLVSIKNSILKVSV